MASFFCMKDMLPPVSQRTYREYNTTLASASKKVALENMLTACDLLHEINEVPPEEVIDVAVTCDGTWSKCGFTGTYGVVVVISW